MFTRDDKLFAREKELKSPLNDTPYTFLHPIHDLYTQIHIYTHTYVNAYIYTKIIQLRTISGLMNDRAFKYCWRFQINSTGQMSAMCPNIMRSNQFMPQSIILHVDHTEAWGGQDITWNNATELLIALVIYGYPFLHIQPPTLHAILWTFAEFM